MKLTQIIIFFMLAGVFFWLMITRKRKPGIILLTDGAYFKRNKILIRYNSVIKIEKDVAILGGGNSTYASFVITYVSGVGNIESIRFYLKYADEQNWKTFKERILSENPQVKFDESIF